MINEVVPGLSIGDYQDTVDHGKEYVSVNVAYEHKDTLKGSLYLPFLTPLAAGGVQINKLVLDALAEIIDLHLAAGHKILVNCNMGIERSPLTVVWFLMKKRGMTLDGAYELVKKQRPQAQDRRQWIEAFL